MGRKYLRCVIFSKIEGTDGQGSQALVDGISEMKVNTANKHIYGINGQYVGESLQSLPKGIYITNGKKVVIK